MTTATAAPRRSDAWRPASVRFSHISLPARDLTQSRKFFSEVLGGALVEDDALRIRFANFDVKLVPSGASATDPDLEYPHWAFTVPAEQFALWKRRLEGFGIPTHDPWTRRGETHTIMYFRDPTGNQFEFFAPEGDTGLNLRLGHRAGGDYVVPFASLVYERLKDRPAAETPGLPATPLAYNHMTIPSKNFGESRRFFTEIFGSPVAFDIPKIHVTVIVGGADIGYGGPADANWPWPDAEAMYPRNTLQIAPDELLPMKARLAQFGVPTSDVWSPSGKDASVLFRDPSSNLWELYCPAGFSGGAQRGPDAGGNYTPNLRALFYDAWKDPGD